MSNFEKYERFEISPRSFSLFVGTRNDGGERRREKMSLSDQIFCLPSVPIGGGKEEQEEEAKSTTA